MWTSHTHGMRRPPFSMPADSKYRACFSNQTSVVWPPRTAPQYTRGQTSSLAALFHAHYVRCNLYCHSHLRRPPATQQHGATSSHPCAPQPRVVRVRDVRREVHHRRDAVHELLPGPAEGPHPQMTRVKPVMQPDRPPWTATRWQAGGLEPAQQRASTPDAADRCCATLVL